MVCNCNSYSAMHGGSYVYVIHELCIVIHYVILLSLLHRPYGFFVS
jgi:hypothetical protein